MPLVHYLAARNLQCAVVVDDIPAVAAALRRARAGLGAACEHAAPDDGLCA